MDTTGPYPFSKGDHVTLTNLVGIDADQPPVFVVVRPPSGSRDRYYIVQPLNERLPPRQALPETLRAVSAAQVAAAAAEIEASRPPDLLPGLASGDLVRVAVQGMDGYLYRVVRRGPRPYHTQVERHDYDGPQGYVAVPDRLVIPVEQ